MVAQTLLGVAYVAYNRVGCHRLHSLSTGEAGRWLSGRTGRS